MLFYDNHNLEGLTMVRTTPARPVDITSVFPELKSLGREATRLHPRRGAPDPARSSVGGPLLWPKSEPWPTCSMHFGQEESGYSIADILQKRSIISNAYRRGDGSGTLTLTEEERQLLDHLESTRSVSIDAPVPYLPLIQLFFREAPWMDWPAGKDLLQILVCPLDHMFLEDDGLVPPMEVRWRTSGDLDLLLDRAPAPPLVSFDHFFPQPCAVHPEKIVEYPSFREMSDELVARLNAWEKRTGNDYFADLSSAPGWVLGGWPIWDAIDPVGVSCFECEAPMIPLLRICQHEWDFSSISWRPVEEMYVHPDLVDNPVGVVYGRDDYIQVYHCSDTIEHPLRRLIT